MFTPDPKKGKKPKKKPPGIDKKLVQEVFDRDCYICQYTGKVFSEHYHELAVHHRVFKSQGGKDDIDNLASIWTGLHTFNHGSLKNKKTINEKDNLEINRLIEYYRNVG
jgi:5-methylcytosine-specific restriction endonuclease McrA